jgi:hypothetical protein
MRGFYFGRQQWFLLLPVLVQSFVPARPFPAHWNAPVYKSHDAAAAIAVPTTIPAVARIDDGKNAGLPSYYANVLATEVTLDPKNTTRIDWALESLVSLTAASAATETTTLLTAASNSNGNNGSTNSVDVASTARTPANLRLVRGLYEVAHVKTVKAGENPVGGKWTRKDGLAQKVFRSRRSFQHILGINETGRGRRTIITTKKKNKKGGSTTRTMDVLGEAVNVISLSAFWGALRATVILRGDIVGLDASERTRPELYQPLSPNAIRALFDSPRIVLGTKGRFCNWSLGPQTTVVLDAPYVDDQIRLGLGARSGTRFVFRRCSPSDGEANEFRELLYRKPLGRIPILAVLGGLSYAAARRRTPAGIAVAILSLLIGLLFGTSGGGIERNDRSIADSKQLYDQ